jgi:hypothetical protein
MAAGPVPFGSNETYPDYSPHARFFVQQGNVPGPKDSG